MEGLSSVFSCSSVSGSGGGFGGGGVVSVDGGLGALVVSVLVVASSAGNCPHDDATRMRRSATYFMGLGKLGKWWANVRNNYMKIAPPSPVSPTGRAH